MLWKPIEASRLSGSRLLHDGGTPISSVCIDSREVVLGSLFVALPGEHTDGHSFLSSASDRGASAVLVRDGFPLPPLPPTVSILSSPDPSSSLLTLASSYRSTFEDLRTIAVTGSYGKTTTRQMIATVLKRFVSTLSTRGNLNNELGVPLTLLRLDSRIDSAVIELGSSRPGDITPLSLAVRPSIAMITSIGTSHLESFGSREAILDAKLEIVSGLSRDGFLILNGNDPYLRTAPSLLSSRGVSVRPIFVGLSEDPFSSSLDSTDPLRLPDGFPTDYPFIIADALHFTHTGVNFNVYISDGFPSLYSDSPSPQPQSYRKVLRRLHLPVYSAPLVLDSLFSVAVSQLYRIPDPVLLRGLCLYRPVGFRQKLVSRFGSRFLLDCYNASPESTLAALEVVHSQALLYGGRSIAVLGDILELGSLSESSHLELGRSIPSYCDILITYGPLSSLIASSAISSGLPSSSVHVFTPDVYGSLPSPSSVASLLRSIIQPNDCVLLKGSHGMRMERIFEAL